MVLAHKQLGATRASVTRAGLGCAQLGNLYSAIDDDKARATVNAAWDSGIRYFDTAPHYGLGLSESRLGEALRSRPRNEYTISTKVGRLLVKNSHYNGERDDAGGFDVPATCIRQWDFSHAGVTSSLESSLLRLGLDAVDIALIHDPELNEADPDQGIREGFPALEKMRSEGVVNAIGVGTRDIRVALEFARTTSIDVIMLAGQFTLINHESLAELLPTCATRNVSILNAAVFNSGILATESPNASSHFDYQGASPSLLERVREIADVCRKYGSSLPQAAIEFSLSHSSIASVVVGASGRLQVERNVHLIEESPSPREMWAELGRRGLVEPQVLESLMLATGGLQ